MKRIMKSRTTALALMVSSLLAMAAGAQARPDKIKTIQLVVVQDDNSGSFLVIDLKTGAYKFHDCKSDFAMGGYVKLTFTGCMATANDESAGTLVAAEINMCTGEARAYLATEAIEGSFEANPPTRAYTITDSNIRDSVAECKTER